MSTADRDGDSAGSSDGPIVVAAFEGWNDAAEAATGVVEHMALTWDSTQLAEIGSEGYYDYQANRPTIRLVDGVARGVTWPATRLTRCRPAGSGRELILVEGVEPNFRWRAFCTELLEILEQTGARMVVTLGALLADTPHTRPVPVSGSAPTPETAEHHGIERSNYEGPTGIAGVLQDACIRAGLPAYGLWAAVPHYLSQPPNPKVMVALLERLERIVDMEIPLGDLPRRAVEWEQNMTAMTDEDEDIAEYVRTLEERGDAEDDLHEAMGQADGDEIAAEFERYLRRRGYGTDDR